MREKWARIMIKNRIDGKVSEEEMIDHFSEAHLDNPTEFEFNPGDRKLIIRLVALVQQMIVKDGLCRFK